MAATNAQVQQWSDGRTRVRAEQIRSLYLLCVDDRATFDDVYANLTSSPTWSDSRSDAPPNAMTPNDLLAINAFVEGFKRFVEGGFTDITDANSYSANYNVVLQACVRSPAV